MSDCFKVIEENLRNLRFSIEFDVYDLSYREQEVLLTKVDELQNFLNEVKSK